MSTTTTNSEGTSLTAIQSSPTTTTSKSDWDELLETRASSFFFRNKNEETHGYLDYSSFTRQTLETPLPDHNRGMKLLMKMGWSKDTGLGKNRTGIVS